MGAVEARDEGSGVAVVGPVVGEGESESGEEAGEEGGELHV